MFTNIIQICTERGKKTNLSLQEPMHFWLAININQQVTLQRVIIAIGSGHGSSGFGSL